MNTDYNGNACYASPSPPPTDNQAEEITDVPVNPKGLSFNRVVTTLSIANETLGLVTPSAAQGKTICNIMDRETYEIDRQRYEKLILCGKTLANYIRIIEEGRSFFFKEDDFLYFCSKIEKESSFFCDTLSLLTYKHLLYNHKTIIPILIGIRSKTIDHLLVAILPLEKKPAKGIWNLGVSIDQLGPNVSIVDPWLGFSTRASNYSRFVKVHSDLFNDYLKKSFISPDAKIEKFIDFTASEHIKSVTAYHLPTLWADYGQRQTHEHFGMVKK